MGCSGSLFGIGALLLIDLLRSWRLIADPGWQLTKLITLMGNVLKKQINLHIIYDSCTYLILGSDIFFF